MSPVLHSQNSVDQSVAGDEEQKTPPASPLEKQGSFSIRKQASVKSTKSVDVPSTFSNASSGEEALIKAEAESSLTTQPRSSVSRTPSVTSTSSQDRGLHGLGRILLTFNYSVTRQRFEVTVNRVA